jgi:hypothetical protein
VSLEAQEPDDHGAVVAPGRRVGPGVVLGLDEHVGEARRHARHH